MSGGFSQQHNQQQTQQQSQQLTHARYQALELLTRPLLDIRSLLEKELADNPLLEIAAPAIVEFAGDTYGDAASAGNEIDPSEVEGSREEISLLENTEDEYYGVNYVENNEDFAGYCQHKYDIASAAIPQSGDVLSDLLWEQLQSVCLNSKERRAAEVILEKIDENGFLKVHLADLAMVHDLAMADLEKALQVVQSFDPP